jgi:hypothetical protein
MNSGIEGNSYGAVISPTRITYKVGQGSTQVIRDAVLIGTNDDEVNYGSTQFSTDLILQIPSMYNNGVYVGSGALSLQVPDGTTKCGNARGVGAIDFQTARSSASQVASGSYSFVAGGYNNTVSGAGTYSFATGYNSTVSGSYAFSAGYNNTASGTFSTVFGAGCSASSTCSVVIGSYSGASGSYSAVIGQNSQANGNNSVAIGSYSLTNGISSKFVIGTVFGGVTGAYQMGQLGLGATTTDATATVLKTDTNTLASSNQCTLQNNNAIAFTVEVVARNTVTGMTGRWEAKGLIKRGANASTTALVGTPTVTLTNGDAEAWIVAGAIAITADTTYGALAITATGAVSTTIHWLTKILTTEVI